MRQLEEAGRISGHAAERKAQAQRIANKHNAQIRRDRVVLRRPPDALQPSWFNLDAIKEALASATVVVGKHPVDAPRRELPYEEFQKFAEIARMPDDDARRRWLHGHVLTLLRTYWDNYHDGVSMLPALLNLHRASRRYLAAWDALTRAAAKHRDAAQEVGDAWDEFQPAQPKAARAGLPNDDDRAPSRRAQIEGDFLEYLALAAEKPFLPARVSERRRRLKTRTAHMLRLAIFLRVLVDEAGGRLVFNKEDENKGTLGALHFLAPYLPPKAIPTRLPRGTIARILRDKTTETGLREILDQARRAAREGGASIFIG